MNRIKHNTAHELNVDKAIQRTNKLSEKESKRRQKMLCPTWKNLDSGRIETFFTNKFPFVRIQIINEDYPGVMIVDLNKLIDNLNNVKKRYLEKEKNETS